MLWLACHRLIFVFVASFALVSDIRQNDESSNITFATKATRIHQCRDQACPATMGK